MRLVRSITSRATIATLLVGVGCSSLETNIASAKQGSAAPKQPKIKTLLLVGGKIHDWRRIGNVLESAMKASGKFEVTRVNNDLDAFLADRVAPYDLVVFYWTLGKLTDAQKRGILDHVAKGKGFVTCHSGADSFRGDKDWHKFVGGHFITHPAYRKYPVTITKEKSPITAGITDFETTDEQYILEYEKDLKILATAPWKGKPMPALWTKSWGKGRVFYHAGGHDARAAKQPMFLKLFLRGCLWAAGREVTD